MSHRSAHNTNTSHGYILLHLADVTKAQPAANAVVGSNQPDVIDADPVSDSILVYVEPAPSSHTPANSQAAHARMDALEKMFMKLTDGTGPTAPKYFDLSSHW